MDLRCQSLILAVFSLNSLSFGFGQFNTDISSYSIIPDTESILGNVNGEPNQHKSIATESGDTLGNWPNIHKLQKRYSSFVRIGKNTELAQKNNKRLSSFVRIGKLFEGNKTKSPKNEDRLDKRMSSFVRIGRNENNFNDAKLTENSLFHNSRDNIQRHLYKIGTKLFNKRKSSFVRIGKNTKNAKLGGNEQ